jgi:hypothetical protein
VWWEYVAAIVAAIGSIAGTTWVIKAIVKHEEQACDARLNAFKEGLDRHD